LIKEASMMTKHDSIIERQRDLINKIMGAREYEIKDLLRESSDLLEAYGKALEAIASESQLKIPNGNGWTYTYPEMAAKAIEQEKGCE